MFGWLKGKNDRDPGIERMDGELLKMLESGRQMFLIASEAMLGDTDPEQIRNEVFTTDESVNQSEQKIRREIVVHVSVQGTGSLNPCLVLMSIVKDAERIGDYAKNIFDLAVEASGIPHDEVHADLSSLREHIIEALKQGEAAFAAQDTDAARRVTRDLAALEDHCDARVSEALKNQADAKCPATVVLLYRYFKRVAAHAMNITSAIFMPLDKIDYFDEEPRPDLPG